ncbi:MAG: hypothetical protein RL653_3009 [Pseudomonadota bacterium]
MELQVGRWARLLSAVCALGLPAGTVEARPVSFLGSRMVMLSGQPMMSSLSVDVTLLRRLAVGASYGWMQRRSDELQLAALDVNVLAYRLNGAGYQANAFLLGNAGAVRDGSAAWRPAGAVAVELDAESRWLYGLVQGRYLRTLDGRLDDLQLLARAGVAPFVAGFQDINPFFVVQYQYLPRFSQPHVVTPMLRLLYRNVLLEVGVSLRGEPLVNVTTEF